VDIHNHRILSKSTSLDSVVIRSNQFISSHHILVRSVLLLLYNQRHGSQLVFSTRFCNQHYLGVDSLYILLPPQRKLPEKYIPLYLITLSTVSEEHALSSSSLCCLLYPLLISSETHPLVLCSEPKFYTVSRGTVTRKPATLR
jgi:hypothetical protein